MTCLQIVCLFYDDMTSLVICWWMSSRKLLLYCLTVCSFVISILFIFKVVFVGVFYVYACLTKSYFHCAILWIVPLSSFLSIINLRYATLPDSTLFDMHTSLNLIDGCVLVVHRVNVTENQRTSHLVPPRFSQFPCGTLPNSDTLHPVESALCFFFLYSWPVLSALCIKGTCLSYWA